MGSLTPASCPKALRPSFQGSPDLRLRCGVLCDSRCGS